jgi:hypothetical protein
LNIGVFKEGLPMPSTSRQRRFQFSLGWPKTFGMGGRIQSEWVAGYSRNPQLGNHELVPQLEFGRIAKAIGPTVAPFAKDWSGVTFLPRGQWA